jgi:putative transposase
MKKMGVEAIYRRPDTSKPAPGHRIYPYLLRSLAVTRPNQVWAADITYVPMARGFVYLVAIVDLFSRKILAWRLSITLSADFCVEAPEEALARHGKPEIFNTDQGSQFTSTDFTKVLMDAEIAISMDGKGAWRDNVFVERLWRTIKYEEVYLRAYVGVAHWCTLGRADASRGGVASANPSACRDGQRRSPGEGPRETRRAAGAGRTGRTTGCRASAFQPERLSMSDPHDLPARVSVTRNGRFPCRISSASIGARPATPSAFSMRRGRSSCAWKFATTLPASPS